MADLNTRLVISAKDVASPAIRRFSSNAKRGFGEASKSAKSLVASLGGIGVALGAIGIGAFVAASVREFNEFDKKIAATGAKARAGAGRAIPA